MSNYKEIKIENGLKVAINEKQDLETVTIILKTRAGSRYEKKQERGYAHFLEHMLLKGTRKRPSAFDISSTIDKLGGYINASTGSEAVSLIIRVPKKYIKTAFELMSDLTFNSLFNKKVLENEKKVILQEIKRYKDNNLAYLYGLTLKNIFGNNPLKQHPLGSSESVFSVTAEKLINYHKKFFVPSNSILVVSGGVDKKKVVKLTNMYFKNWSDRKVELDKTNKEDKILESKGYIFKKTSSEQYSLSLATSFNKKNIKEDLALDLFHLCLGVGQASVLYDKLRNKEGLIYALKVNNQSFFKNINLFSIITSTTKPKKVVNRINSELKKTHLKINDSYFKDLKKQFINRLLMSIDNPIIEANIIGNSWISENKIVTPKEIIDIVNGLNLSDFKDVVKRLLETELSLTITGKKDPFYKTES